MGIGCCRWKDVQRLERCDSLHFDKQGQIEYLNTWSLLTCHLFLYYLDAHLVKCLQYVYQLAIVSGS